LGRCVNSGLSSESGDQLKYIEEAEILKYYIL